MPYVHMEEFCSGIKNKVVSFARVEVNEDYHKVA